MKRRFRLTRSTDFKRVRSNGKSYAHPLLVLVITPRETPETTRIGVTASRGIGGAVVRNRAKRLMREAMRPMLAEIQSGWDVVAIARTALVSAEFTQIQSALRALLRRARLITVDHEQ